MHHKNTNTMTIKIVFALVVTTIVTSFSLLFFTPTMKGAGCTTTGDLWDAWRTTACDTVVTCKVGTNATLKGVRPGYRGLLFVV